MAVSNDAACVAGLLAKGIEGWRMTGWKENMLKKDRRATRCTAIRAVAEQNIVNMMLHSRTRIL
ncbi:MAG: hypothetical protein MI749_04485 [Desulfovibrionales bacterium]|nr:hypothetical protein [Desulfovibrionales bacterium]